VRRVSHRRAHRREIAAVALATQPERNGFLGITVRAALAAGLVTLLFQTGSMSGLQESWADAISRVFRAVPSGQVLLVGITDADYNRTDLFAGLSPLDPAVLLRLFQRLAQHRPAVVAVDIGLQPPPYELPERRESRRQLYRGLSRLAESGATHWVLVETPPTDLQDGDSATLELWRSLHELTTRTPSGLTFASPQIRAESGVIRHVRRCWSETAPAQPAVSLFGAVIGALDSGDRCTAGEPGADLHIRYTGGFASRKPGATGAGRVLTTGDLLQPAAGPRGDTVLTGKAVIVGGLYSGGMDTYWTPLGTLFGAEIWAEAVDTWRRGDALHEPSWPVIFILQAAIGMLSGWLSVRLGRVRGHVAAMLLFATLTVVFTWLSSGVGFVVVSALPAFLAAQLNVHVTDLPNLIADRAQGMVERRRK
jgi:CHASE2 domain-containing sensor protein